jgi:23S rRNA pseudouridine1911/1915/1917 synthase
VTDHRELVVAPPDAGARLDRFLADRIPELSRSRLQELVREGVVRVDGTSARPSARLEAGAVVAVDLPPVPVETGPAPAPHLIVALLHLDDDVVVVDKPPGQVVHPAAGHAEDTLVNALLALLPDLATVFGGPRPGLVHRLDRDTSGVMVVARTPQAAEALKRQFKARTVEKTYLVLAKGHFASPEGVIDAPVGRDPRRRRRMAALRDGRPAQTAYRVLAASGDYSFLEARPHTGRTHQIRVHLDAIGHPVAGDAVYGHRDRRLGRMALHAWRLAFDHPADGRRVTFTAPLPADLRAALVEVGIAWAEEE